MRVGRISGTAIYRNIKRANSKLFSLMIGGGFYEWGSNSVAVPPLRISGERWISIQPGVYIGPGCWLNAEPDNGVAAGPIIVIGKGSSFAGNCVISAVSSVKIGSEVLFARNVYVADHSHAHLDIARSIMRQGITGVGQIIIDDGAWLGQNVVVTPGVHIGRGAVVAANAVVRSDVPDYSLAVGVPARVVKSWRYKEVTHLSTSFTGRHTGN